MSNTCQEQGIVYGAKVTAAGGSTTYTVVTKSTLKIRHRGHKTRFKKRKYSKATNLSGYVWEKKDNGENMILHGRY